MTTLFVTGGAGFIGSALVRHLLRQTDATVVTLDKLTYAGSLETLADVRNHPRHIFVQVDVADAPALETLFARHRPEAVLHLAAETHVDRSIDGPAAFIQTNITGTYVLLETARRYWQEQEGSARERFRFLHVSTDEVFGSLGAQGAFCETSPYAPNSPYSASKAAADHLVRAWRQTYGLPVLITNCSNNYGPFQFPEKLIPLMIAKALSGQPLPVYGDGGHVRDWLYVDDHVRALLTVLAHGRVGETYVVGGGAEMPNRELVLALCALLDRLEPDPAGPRSRLLTFVPDRPGHDRRYAIAPDKIRRELGWQATETFASGLEKTVCWYLQHRDWLSALGHRYAGQRLGLTS